MRATNALRHFVAGLRLFAIAILFGGAAFALVIAIGAFSSAHPAEGIVGLLLATGVGSIGALRLRLWLEVRRAGK